jgi:hypothetical protein
MSKNALFWDMTPCGSCKNRRLYPEDGIVQSDRRENFKSYTVEWCSVSLGDACWTLEEDLLINFAVYKHLAWHLAWFIRWRSRHMLMFHVKRAIRHATNAKNDDSNIIFFYFLLFSSLFSLLSFLFRFVLLECPEVLIFLLLQFHCGSECG